MSNYKTVYTEVDVNISDFDTEDLLDELESRGELPPGEDEYSRKLIEKIWFKRRIGNNTYQEELNQLIYQVLGHIV